MPRVPLAENVSVLPDAPRAPQARMLEAPEVRDYGSRQILGQSEALARAGGAATGIAADMIERANRIRISDAANKAIEARNRLTYDPQQGFLHLRGEAALNRPDQRSLDDEYTERFQTELKAIEDTLGNESQKAAFQQQATQMITELRGSVGRHVAKEFGEYAVSVQDGTIATARQQMTLAWGDAQALEQGRGAIKAAVYERGRLLGHSGAQIEASMLEALSPGHAAVVAQAVDAGKVEYARAYLRQHEGELTPSARLQLTKAVDEGAFEARTQTTTESLLARAGGDAVRARALARETLSGKDEDAVIQRLNQRDAEMAVQAERTRKAIGDRGWSEVMERGRLSPSTRAALLERAPEELRQIGDWLDARARRAKADADGKKTEDFGLYYGLRRMAMDDPTAFASLDLRRVAPMLSKGQVEQLVDIQGKVSSSDAKAMESQRVLKSTLEMVKGQAAAVGVDLSPKEGTESAKKTAQFLGALTMALDQAVRAKGSPLTADESRRIGMEMLREGIEQGSGVFGMFQTKKRGFEIATDPSIGKGANFVAARFGDIPKAVRDELVAEYRTRNNLGARGPLSSAQEAEIERAYTRGVQQGRF